MRKFEFKKSYEEIEIDGEIFKVSLKDEDRKNYSKQLSKFHEMINDIDTKNIDKITIDDAIAMEDRVKDITLETIDVLFGDGSSEKLYKKADEQVEEIIPIVFAVAELINERRQETMGKYTKKKVK